MADPGEGPGPAPPPLFLDQTEARKAEKIIFLRPGPSPYLSVWMTVPRPPFIWRCGSATVSMYNTSAWFVLEDPTMKVVGPSIWNCLCPSSLYSCWNENSISKLSINQYYVFPTSEGTTRQEFNQTSTALSTKQLPRQLWNVQFPYSTGVPLSIHSGNAKETKWMPDLTYIPLTLSVCF